MVLVMHETGSHLDCPVNPALREQCRSDRGKVTAMSRVRELNVCMLSVCGGQDSGEVDMSVVVLLAQLVVDDDELRLPLRAVLLPGLGRQARIVSEPCVTRPIPSAEYWRARPSRLASVRATHWNPQCIPEQRGDKLCLLLFSQPLSL
jgi:hypothetical protein